MVELATPLHSCSPGRVLLHHIHSYIFMYVDAPALFRLLGDDVRLRLLRVLHAERLNVTELTSILGIAQSGVSRHLGLLKEAGLVSEQREGGFTYFRPAPALSDAQNGFGPLAALLEAHFTQAAKTPLGPGGRRAPGRSAAAAEREFRGACRAGYAGPPARAGPELGGLGARARPAAAAPEGRRPRAAAKATSRWRPAGGPPASSPSITPRPCCAGRRRSRRGGGCAT